MKSTGVFMKSDTTFCDMKISSGSTSVNEVCEPVVLTSCGGLWHRGGVLLFLPGLLRSSVRFGLSGRLRPMESSADKRQVSDISGDASEKKMQSSFETCQGKN